jgi:hypothetical protein
MLSIWTLARLIYFSCAVKNAAVIRHLLSYVRATIKLFTIEVWRKKNYEHTGTFFEEIDLSDLELHLWGDFRKKEFKET